MAQLTKIEAQTQIKSSPAKIFDFHKNKLHHFANVFPQVIKTSQLLEGPEGCVGSIHTMKFALDGTRTVSSKFKTEEINEGERSIVFNFFEGDHTKLYNRSIGKLTVGNDFVKWCLEVEKADDSVPNPDGYLSFGMEATKVLDAYLLNN